MQGLIKLYIKSGKVSLNRASLFFYRRAPFVAREWAAYSLAMLRKSKLPEKRFVIFAQGRTGSTVLVDLMNSHPDVFTFGEIMDYDVIRNLRNPRRYAEGICSLSKSPATGFKVKIYQFENAQRQEPKKVLVDFHENGWKLIYLKRSNIFRHAISDIRSEMTGEFHNVKGTAVGGKQPTRRKLRIDPGHLIHAMRFREDCIAREQRALESLPHFVVEYEKDLLGPDAQHQTMNRVFEFLDLPPHQAETKFRKVTSHQISDDIENVDELEAELKRHDYGKFLGWG